MPSEIDPQVLGRTASSAVEATLFSWKGSYLTLLSAATEDERLPVGIESMPVELVGPYSNRLVATWRRSWAERLELMLADVDEVPASAVLPRRLTQDLLRARDRHLARLDATVFIDFSKVAERYSDPWAEEVRESLKDALTYWRAALSGESVVQAVADERRVTPRSAEGRIRRARLRGLLTEAEDAHTPSTLTARAADLVEASTGQRPYPHVSEDGTPVLGPTE